MSLILIIALYFAWPCGFCLTGYTYHNCFCKYLCFVSFGLCVQINIYISDGWIDPVKSISTDYFFTPAPVPFHASSIKILVCFLWEKSVHIFMHFFSNGWINRQMIPLT